MFHAFNRIAEKYFSYVVTIVGTKNNYIKYINKFATVSMKHQVLLAICKNFFSFVIVKPKTL